MVRDAWTPFFPEPDRRRTFVCMTKTERKWSERVAEWRESGQTAREFSAGRGFSDGGLRHWAYRLKRLGVAPAVRRPSRVKREVTVPRSVVPAQLRVVRLERMAAAVSPSVLTVEIGAARLRVPEGAHAATLQTTLGALVEAILGGSR